jgi:hypothetical protein
MAKQTFTTGQVLTAAQMTSLQQTAMLGGAASAKTASYTLVAADAGSAISMSNASATTITVNTALFAAGDTVHITNLGAGVCTITAGTATVNSSASLALAQYESGFLDFTSTSAAIFVKGAGAAAASGSLTLLSTTSLTGSSVSVSSISQSYTNLFFIFRDVYVSADNRPLYMTASGATLTGSHSWFGVQGTTVEASSARGDVYMTLATKMGSTSGSSYLSSGSFTVTNYATTATKTVFGNSIALNDSGTRTVGTLAGEFYTASALNELTVYLVGGNTFGGGQLLIYGVN